MVTSRSELKASSIDVLIDECRGTLNAVQYRIICTLIKVFTLSLDLATDMGTFHVRDGMRCTIRCHGSRGTVKGKAFFARVEFSRAIQRFEHPIRYPFSQRPKEPTGLEGLAHVG